MASKIIVLGDVNGQLGTVFTKLANLHTKNNFSFAIVAGNLFSEQDDDAVADLLTGTIVVPLATYFTVGTTALPSRILEKIERDEEICPNLHFLGKRSTTKTSEGIRIVTLGGQLDESIIGLSKEQHLPFHTVADAKTLVGANSADILLTSCWPASIRTGPKVLGPDGVIWPPGQQYISELCTALKPRYHFSTSPDLFYEREPFFHAPNSDSPDVRSVTRFISLAAQGNSHKQKALYAFSLSPLDPTASLPLGTTASPFRTEANGRKRQALDPDPFPRYANHDGNGYRRNKYARGGRGNRQPPPGPDQCFFCLANETVSQHLLSAIGDNSYLTTAKGPLTTPSTYSEVGIDYPAHILIIPLAHSPTLAMISEPDNPNSKADTFAEMARFKEALQNMIAKSSGNKLGAVTYEISKADGIHTHWQFIPMPAETIQKGLVEAAFRVEAENLSYPPFEVRDPGLGENDGDFFRAWIWTPPGEENGEGSTKCLTMPFDANLRFSLQFGRTVLAKLLNLEKRIQWRECTQSQAEEERDVEAFKTAFKPYDFSA